MEIIDNKIIEITGLHPSKTINNIMKIFDNELQRDQIDIRDESTTTLKYVVEIPPYRRLDINDIYNRLERGLSNTESYKFIFADNGIAVFSGLHGVVKHNLEYLIKVVNRKFEKELKVLKDRYEILDTIELMKKKNDIVNIINKSTSEAVSYISKTYKISDEQARAVLSKPISYLTKEHMNEIVDIQNKIKETEKHTKDVFSYLIKVYQSLKKDVSKFTKSYQYSEFENI
jgi:DNA gyrase/topoisomerase IV subunit A